MTAPRIVTIGVHGRDGASFVEALRAAGVDVLVDVRQRRGVRGADHAWANSRRLQAALAAAGIEYRHHRELAPTTELREVQYAEDARQGVGKRSRRVLGEEYRRRYLAERLDHVDLGTFAAELEQRTAALLCVESEPQACHRSLIAQRLAERHGLTVQHLPPATGAG